jgi:hypothetical protein
MKKPPPPLLMRAAFVELLDQDQIVEDWNTYKLGAGSPPTESPAPISPLPPYPRGRGRHFRNRLCPFSGRERICDREFFLRALLQGVHCTLAMTQAFTLGFPLSWLDRASAVHPATVHWPTFTPLSVN